MIRTLLLLASLAVIAARPAAAQPRMDGTFTATQACPALQSIRRQDNPGGVTLEPGHAYRVVGKNKPDATFYQLLVDGAAPARRWVAIGCGQITAAAGPAAPAAGTADAMQPATHLLALGWEPAFCRSHGDKAECRRQTAESAEATQLSLHGLWPQPRGKAYCGVDPRFVQADRVHNWDGLPEPELTATTRQRLGAVMPGVQSGLQRHEWVVHGTCFGTPADAYFNRAAGLTEQVDASAVRDLFVQNIGSMISADAIRAAFDRAFGAGAGARVTIACDGQGTRREISEIRIALAGDVTGDAPLAALIQSAAPLPAGCPGGMVDRTR